MLNLWNEKIVSATWMGVNVDSRDCLVGVGKCSKTLSYADVLVLIYFTSQWKVAKIIRFSCSCCCCCCYSCCNIITEAVIFLSMWFKKFYYFAGDFYDTWCQFHQRSTSSFYRHGSQKRKKTLMTKLYFLRFWDLWA